MSFKIQNDFLRSLVNYYGNFSLQLRPVNRSSLLNLLWNLTLFFFCWAFIIVSIGDGKSKNKEMQTTNLEHLPHKPLLQRCILISASSFILGMTLCTVYFIVLNFHAGTLLIRLDSFPRIGPIPNWILPTILLLDHLIFIIVYRLFYHLHYFDFTNIWGYFKFFSLYLSFYTLHVNAVIIFGLTAYYKWATLVSLQAIQDLTTTSTTIYHLKDELRSLADLNFDLNHQLAFPLMLSLFMETFNAIVMIAQAFVFHDHYTGNLIYVLLYLGAIFTLGVLQDRIDVQLERLKKTLDGLFRPKEDGRQLFQLAVSGSGKSHESIRFRATSVISIYRKYFALKLFDLCYINVQFILLLVLFAVNYIVLITQTTVS